MPDVFPAATTGNAAVSIGGPGDHLACDAEMARLRAVAAGGAREVQRAITEAVSAERERADSATAMAAAAEAKLLEYEARLRKIAAHCRERMNRPGRSGMTMAAAGLILGIAEGSSEEEAGNGHV